MGYQQRALKENQLRRFLPSPVVAVTVVLSIALVWAAFSRNTFHAPPPLSGQLCRPLDLEGRLQKYGHLSIDFPPPAMASPYEGQQLLAQALHFTWSFNRAEAIGAIKLAEALGYKSALLSWAETYARGPFLNRVEHAADPGFYPAFLPADFTAISVMAQSCLSTAQEQLAATSGALGHNSTEHALELEAATFQLELATAAAERFSPALLSSDTAGFEEGFQQAQRRYGEALEKLARQHGSADLLAMAAEALMLPGAWNSSEELHAGGSHARQLLCEALLWNPQQPLSLHMQIHATEMGNPLRPDGDARGTAANCSSLPPEIHVSEGESAAEILAVEQGPWSSHGHLVHMAAHTFIRLGRYNDAVAAGQRALHQDAVDAKDCQATVATEHSAGVTIYAANMAGQSQLAIELSTKLRTIAEEFPIGGWLQGSPTFDWTALPLTWAFHGLWWEILEKLQPPPPNARGICERQGFQYASGLYHYAMALALAATSETSGYHGNREAASSSLLQAESHLQRLKEVADGLQPDVPTRPGTGAGLYGCEYKYLARIQVEMASARIAQATGDYPGNVTAAALHLEQAVQLEAGLSYALPPRQYQPARHCQAHVFERLLRPDAAEAAARDALRLHPNNAWALYALKGSLEKQGGGEEEVEMLSEALETAWKNGDRVLNCPCPIFVVF